MEDSFLDLSPYAEIFCTNVGKEEQPFLQVNSFMKDASVLKNRAISTNCFAVADSYYPGVRMPIPDYYPTALLKNLKHIINSGFGFSADKIKSIFSSYSIVTLSPSELKLEQRVPHFDFRSKKSLAFVHYLCDSDDSGTSLYRHKETGFEYIDEARATEYTRHLRHQFADTANHPEGYIVNSTAVFEQIHSCKASFNRLIAYRGCSLHSGNIPPNSSFSPDPSVGRLTITSLFEFE